MEPEPDTTVKADSEVETDEPADAVVFVVPTPTRLGAASESMFARFPLSTAS